MTTRAIATDFYQNFRYHVIFDGSGGAGEGLMAFSKEVGGGFNTLTLPELTMDAVEYREGTSVYTKKFAGIPTFSEVTLTRGVTHKDTDFWAWAKGAADGGEYRAVLTILHFSRKDAEDQKNKLHSASEASRMYICHNCVPIRCKVAADMDATSGDVSIAELGVAVEEMEVRTPG